jgi:capsular polysaccharide biosynthesis protein
MKRILKLLAHLYPSTWRHRYGAEYEALLDDATPRPQDAFNILWGAIKMQLTSRSFVRIILPCAIAGALIATAISFAIQPRYVSQTLITVTESAPVTEDNLKQILLSLQPSVLNRDFLTSVIQKYDLYPGERATMSLDKVLDKMSQSIAVRPLHSSPAKVATAEDKNTIGFAIDFVYSDPHLAQLVEGDLVSRFVEANLSRRENSASADRPQPGEVFRVADAPDLPNSPTFPKRGVFALGGLAAGLLFGLILATIIGPRHNTTTVSS